ncbi:MAG: hypothetical protein JKY53_09560 [Flavobacteriales bacterium]|nr:hypothetical protein [Flavobacteriales bacterium]
MKNRVFLLLCVFLYEEAQSQPVIPNTTVIIKENKTRSSPATSKNYETKKKSFYRNVQFDVLLGSSCIYDLGNVSDQTRWNKFLKLTP